MKPGEFKKAFKAFLKERKISEKALTPETGFAAMCDFYRSIKFDCAGQDESNDMLLFQYGTYDWGEGENFELNLTRQLIEAANPSEDEDNNILQLGITFLYPSAKIGKVESFNQWSEEFRSLDPFLKVIEESRGYRAALKATPTKIQITADIAG